jgi:hypothetical protein
VAATFIWTCGKIGLPNECYEGIDTAAMKEWCEVRETVEEMQCCEWCAVRKQESNAVSGIRCDVTKRAGVISASLGRHRTGCLRRIGPNALLASS